MSISITWSPYFQSNARRQGRALQLNEKVKRLEAKNNQVLYAQVVDKSNTHSVDVIKEGKAAIASCSCDTFAAGRLCKHIWAALMDVQYSDNEKDIATTQTLSTLTVRPPKARKRVSASAISRTTKDEPDWMGRLSLLKSSSTNTDSFNEQIFPAQRQIYFVILPRLCAKYNGLVIELRQRTSVASGWSKPKPLKLSSQIINDLASKEDREICSLLIGSTWTGDQISFQARSLEKSRATYCLPQGAQITLLKKIINTKRCFIEIKNKKTSDAPQQIDNQENSADDKNDGNLALRWDGDEPWVLWAVGKLSDENLNVNAQLRRGKDKMDIKNPALILGGGNGLTIYGNKAAPFDDRGAPAWIAQFRKNYSSDSKAQSLLHIPKKDINQFLDRLYMLGALPEIDFPPNIRRDEKLIKPTPTLELFSPDSAKAKKLTTSVAKQQLVGQVSFYYGQSRVSAAKQGVFISTESNQNNQFQEASSAIDTDIDKNKEQKSDRENANIETQEKLNTENKQAQDLIRRDIKRENDALKFLMSQGFRHLSGSAQDSVVLAQNKMHEAAGALLASGWQVSADKKMLQPAGPPNLTISSGMDWFELHGQINFEKSDGTQQQVTLPQILAAARSGAAMIELDDGSKGLLPQQWLEEHGLLTTLGEVEDDHLKFKRSQTALLNTLLEEKDLSFTDDTFNKARQKLNEFSGIEPLDPDAKFRGNIRNYQRQGLGWMAFLRNFGMGGILADDMGLGKTIQVLAMLQARKNEDEKHCAPDKPKDCKRPSLIVAPKSVVFNWIDEAKTFTPDMKVLAYTGTDRKQLRKEFNNHDVIVMSYGLIRRDIENLSKYEFDYIVLDEAQAIKNSQSQGAKAARLLKSKYRLALTGTPVENHLGDLWSIFEFLNPGILGSNAKFTKLLKQANSANNTSLEQPDRSDFVQEQAENLVDNEYEQYKEDDSKENAMALIAAALRPFILRRNKQEVLTDLPEKTEQTIYCQMDQEQRSIYDELSSYYRSTLIDQLDSQKDSPTNSLTTSGGNTFMVLEALLRLRQAACHPGLINEDNNNAPSAKLDSLEQMLDDVLDEGGKSLVFSQFTSMLSLVRQRLDARGIKYCYLDGKTRNRKKIVEEFQNDEQIQVFLISLKAGGVGLNLTAAEYVFILDPWWNPAVEAQAIDRAHRIGQSKPVFAYRMICQDTVEQRIIELQSRKRDLAEQIVEGEGKMLSNLSRDDLAKLLS